MHIPKVLQDRVLPTVENIRVQLKLTHLVSFDWTKHLRHKTFISQWHAWKKAKKSSFTSWLGASLPERRGAQTQAWNLCSNPDGDLIATIFCELPGSLHFFGWEMFFSGRELRNETPSLCRLLPMCHSPPTFSTPEPLAKAQSGLSVCTNRVEGNDSHWETIRDSGWVLKHNWF